MHLVFLEFLLVSKKAVIRECSSFRCNFLSVDEFEIARACGICNLLHKSFPASPIKFPLNIEETEGAGCK